MDRLLALLKEEVKTNFHAFCYMEGYIFSVAAIESVLHLILEIFRFTGTETWQTLYLEVLIFDNIICAIVIFSEVRKTRRWKMV